MVRPRPIIVWSIKNLKTLYSLIIGIGNDFLSLFQLYLTKLGMVPSERVLHIALTCKDKTA